MALWKNGDDLTTTVSTITVTILTTTILSITTIKAEEKQKDKLLIVMILWECTIVRNIVT